MTIPAPDLATAARQWIAAEVQRLRADRPDAVLFAITLQPNSIAPRSGTDADALDLVEAPQLHRFAATMDRVHLGFGDRFRRMRRHRTTYLVVGQRGLSGSLHWHGLVLAEPSKAELFQEKAGPVWNDVSRGGSLHLEPEPDTGWLAYSTRHLARPQPFICHVIPEPRRH